MSASQNKKQRAAEAAAVSLRTQEEEQRAKRSKRNKIIAIIVAVFLVLAIAVILLFNSNFFYNFYPAYSIGGRDFSAAEFNYFYYSQYLTYYNEIVDYYGESYSGDYLPVLGTSFRSQTFNTTANMSWHDFLKTYTESYLRQLVSVYNDGQAKGFQLTDDQKADVEKAMTDLPYNARNAEPATYGFIDGSVEQYLRLYYGKGMNEKVYRKCIEFYAYCYYYMRSVSSGYTYTTEQLEAAYKENADTYDYFKYMVGFVKADTGTSEEPIELSAAMDAAGVKADSIKAAITDQDSFVQLMTEYAEELGKDPEEYYDVFTYQGQELASYAALFNTWLLEEGRAPGDTAVFNVGGTETSTTNGKFIIMFLERDKNDYHSVNITYLAVNAQTVTKEDEMTDEEYQAKIQEAKEAAKKAADDIKAAWDAGTYESAGALYNEFKYDLASTPYPYTQLSKPYVGDYALDWAFDSQRKENEMAVFERTSGNSTVYSILIFNGTDERVCDLYARDELVSKDYKAWMESITEGVNGQEKFAIRNVGGVYPETAEAYWTSYYSSMFGSFGLS